MRLRVGTVLLLWAWVASAEPLTLPQLIEKARANDHRVKEASAQLRYLKSKYQEAKWAWFPRVDSYFAVAGPMPEARNDGLGGPPTTEATIQYDLNFGQPGVMFRAGAEAVLPIWTFGKLDALEEAGAKGVVLGESLATRARDEAEMQVAQAYYGYCFAQEAREVIVQARKQLADARVTLERLREQNSEQVTQMDFYKFDYFKAQVESQISAAESGRNLALAAIRLLIALPENEPLEIAVEPLQPLAGSLLPIDAYMSQVKANRPELKAIEAGIAVREQEVIIRERFYYPDFGIAGFVRWMWTTSATRQKSPFAYDPYNDASGGVALVARYQWDFPQKGAALEQARAELEKLQHQRDLLGAAVRLEVEKAWNQTNDAMLRATQQAQAEKSARKWVTAAYAAFDVGTGNTRDLVDAFSALALSSAARVQAVHDSQVGLRTMTRAMGVNAALTTVTESPKPLPAKLVPLASDR